MSRTKTKEFRSTGERLEEPKPRSAPENEMLMFLHRCVGFRASVEEMRLNGGGWVATQKDAADHALKLVLEGLAEGNADVGYVITGPGRAEARKLRKELRLPCLGF